MLVLLLVFVRSSDFFFVLDDDFVDDGRTLTLVLPSRDLLFSSDVLLDLSGVSPLLRDGCSILVNGGLGGASLLFRERPFVAVPFLVVVLLPPALFSFSASSKSVGSGVRILSFCGNCSLLPTASLLCAFENDG